MRRSKYGNVRTVVNGITFASKAEAARYRELVAMQKAKMISDLQIQQPFSLLVNGKLVCKYMADFTYKFGSTPIVEDVKGVRTAVYRLKAKLMLACYGITITEIGARRKRK